MPYMFPPELSQLVQQKMASGLYSSEDDLLVEAIHALNNLQAQHAELRGEIRSRLEKSGQGFSQPLDVESIKTEARRRLAEEG